jgi:Ran GTPase-activating protein (RanGAP) involved in mRNA processing and transport
LFESLHFNTTLVDLNVGNLDFQNANRLGSLASDAIEILLKKQVENNGVLNMLGLRHLQLANDGLAKVSKGLKVNRTIRILDLVHNEITGEGVKNLVEKSLLHQPRITDLFISHAISGIVIINLSENPIGNTGAVAIA